MNNATIVLSLGDIEVARGRCGVGIDAGDGLKRDIFRLMYTLHGRRSSDIPGGLWL
jgi:hypothetical protein